MLAMIVAIAAATAPQYTTAQGNGHHSNDERRQIIEDGARARPATSENRKNNPADKRKPGVESRDSDGVLMPGAPGTKNPEIPEGG